MVLAPVTSHTIAGRTFKASDWTAGHLTHTIRELEEKYPTSRLVILQPCFNVGVDASAGTHDFDCVFDVQITGMTWAKAQAFLRQLGWAAWHRTPAQGFKDHIHMASIPAGLSGSPTAKQVGEAYARLGLKVGKYIDGGWTTSNPHRITASCQVADYFAHAYGLAGAHASGSDRSWFPPDIASTIYKPTATAPKELTVAERAKTLAQHVVNEVNTDRRLDLDDLDALIRLGHQPEAAAAKAFRDAVIAGYRTFHKAVD